MVVPVGSSRLPSIAVPHTVMGKFGNESAADTEEACAISIENRTAQPKDINFFMNAI